MGSTCQSLSSFLFFIFNTHLFPLSFPHRSISLFFSSRYYSISLFLVSPSAQLCPSTLPLSPLYGGTKELGPNNEEHPRAWSDRLSHGFSHDHHGSTQPQVGGGWDLEGKREWLLVEKDVVTEEEECQNGGRKEGRVCAQKKSSPKNVVLKREGLSFL